MSWFSKLKAYSWPVHGLALCLVIFLVLFYNQNLWQLIFSIEHTSSLAQLQFIASFFIFVVALLYCFTLWIGFRPLFKPLSILILLTSAAVSYFMTQYGVLMDNTMMQNVIETDPKEAGELFNIPMLFNLLVWGVLPALLLFKLPVTYPNFVRGVLHKVVLSAVSLAIAVAAVYVNYDPFASLARNNRELRHLITPSNYLYASYQYLKELLPQQVREIKPIGLDATQGEKLVQDKRPNVMILVVGETARAESFSLGGYQRNTNPELSKLPIIYFPEVSSCGTATAVSLPCMFSQLKRDNYSDSKAKSQQSVLDVVSHSGVSVFWRDNNSGCKGACDRVKKESVAHFDVPEFCNKEECFDEILLHKLDDYINQLQGDALIVLHQKGSHGPSYDKRYPDNFRQFKPVCETNQLQKCTQEQIMNAYDNTILYTDYFLAQTIKFLQQRSTQLNGALLYASDHGESLGENNIYLHGVPYMIAPSQQTHIPMLAWFSPQFEATLGLSHQCMQQIRSKPYSHDNLFHTVLGLMNVQTTIYLKELDMFADCRGEG